MNMLDGFFREKTKKDKPSSFFIEGFIGIIVTKYLYNDDNITWKKS